jgi:hypothetical protein
MNYWEAPDYWQKLERLANHHEPRITKSYNETLAEFNEKHNEAMYLYNKRDMTVIMHAHLRGRIKANFHGVPGAYTIDKLPWAFMLVLDGHPIGIPVFAIFKFKKQRLNLRTANIQTNAVKDFNSQNLEFIKYIPQIQLAIPGLGIEDKVANRPRGSALIAGYTPKPTWAAYERLTICFPVANGKIKLISQITPLSVETLNNVVELPKQEHQQVKRIRRKQGQSAPTRTKLRKFINQEQPQQEDNQDARKRKQ